MIKRLHIYLKEMYPVIPRLLLGLIVFLEIYFIVLLNNGITEFNIGIQEVVGAITVFSFLLWLRVADDLKDYETDKKLFKNRPLPSGRVYKKDIIIMCSIVQAIAITLNLIFMNNLLFLCILYGYGFLMSKWFFRKKKIQPNLLLAVITHNPVQLFVNMYIISFTCIKYNLNPFTLTTLMALFTLYFPALIWEIARKIKAPKDENAYNTYSKIFGYEKATKFILIITLIDIVTNIVLVYNLNKISIFVLIALVSWMTYKFIKFIKDPTQYRIVDKVERYTYFQESTMLLTVVIYLLIGKI